MSEIDLKSIQVWTQEVLVRRGNLLQKIAQASQKVPVEIDDLIQTKKGLSASKRLDIYASGYVLRLLECLAADYPGLKVFMGDELFDMFGRAYIVSSPSQSYSLYHFTNQYPEYLTRTIPPEKKGEVMFELPAEIAHFERARAEVAIEKGTEGMTIRVPDMIELMMGDIQLERPNCVRLLQQNYDVKSLLVALEEEVEYELPERKLCYVAMTRKNYLHNTIALEEWQYHLLSVFSERKFLKTAIEEAALLIDNQVEDIRSKAIFWLPGAIAEGLLFV